MPRRSLTAKRSTRFGAAGDATKYYLVLRIPRGYPNKDLMLDEGRKAARALRGHMFDDDYSFGASQKKPGTYWVYDLGRGKRNAYAALAKVRKLNLKSPNKIELVDSWHKVTGYK